MGIFKVQKREKARPHVAGGTSMDFRARLRQVRPLLLTLLLRSLLSLQLLYLPFRFVALFLLHCSTDTACFCCCCCLSLSLLLVVGGQFSSFLWRSSFSPSQFLSYVMSVFPLASPKMFSRNSFGILHLSQQCNLHAELREDGWELETDRTKQ